MEQRLDKSFSLGRLKASFKFLEALCDSVEFKRVWLYSPLFAFVCTCLLRIFNDNRLDLETLREFCDE